MGWPGRAESNEGDYIIREQVIAMLKSFSQNSCDDVVEAHATVLNRTEMLLTNQKQGVNCSETFEPRGSLSVTKKFLTVL